MNKQIAYGAGSVLLVLLMALQVWQGSFRVDVAGPTATQAVVYWAISLLIFVLTVAVAFMLARTFIKLYFERRNNRDGSRIRTKLVVGGVLLIALPISFQAFYSYSVMNRNVDKWFNYPQQQIKIGLDSLAQSITKQQRLKLESQARWLASRSDLQRFVASPTERPGSLFDAECRQMELESLLLVRADHSQTVLCSNTSPSGRAPNRMVSVSVPAVGEGGIRGELIASGRLPVDVALKQIEINRYVDHYNDLYRGRNDIRRVGLNTLVLVTLFTLFVGIWPVLFLARQLSLPVTALLDAAREVRSGNLSYRVRTPASDELATLVRAFNEMTEDLEHNSRELERRRLFTEAILESIPTGVISLTADGRIQRVNRALKAIFSEEQAMRANRLADLFPPSDMTELRYLINRARRTGIAATELELHQNGQTIRLAVTLSALKDPTNTGFVLVLEDTSELFRVQKVAAWQEVARRVAHEIKNPLTPISLCADRIARQLDKPASDDQRRILRECAAIIGQEVNSLKGLVNEFSEFSRLPAAQLAPADLNDVVEMALNVFSGRLEEIDIEKDLAAGLPAVPLDREQFKRAVVNLVDNAAEAMQNSLFRKLYIRSRLSSPDTVELEVTDTGCGISADDKEKLFVPYFSTKGRGTGLGLAIVNRIVAEHNAIVRVEDNRPTGARFLIELPVAAVPEQDGSPLVASI